MSKFQRPGSSMTRPFDPVPHARTSPILPPSVPPVHPGVQVSSTLASPSSRLGAGHWSGWEDLSGRPTGAPSGRPWRAPGYALVQPEVISDELLDDLANEAVRQMSVGSPVVRFEEDEILASDDEDDESFGRCTSCGESTSFGSHRGASVRSATSPKGFDPPEETPPVFWNSVKVGAGVAVGFVAVLAGVNLLGRAFSR